MLKSSVFWLLYVMFVLGWNGCYAIWSVAVSSIATAQEAFAKDWIAAYQKYYEHGAAQTSR